MAWRRRRRLLSSSFNPISIKAVLLSSVLLFLLLPSSLFSSPSDPSHRRRLHSSAPTPQLPCSAVLRLPPAERCSFSRSNCASSGGLFNYSSLHFCFLSSFPSLSLPALSLFLLFLFHLLARTASDRFSPAVSLLSDRLCLSPSMAAVTLLALGNGAPDLFASVAALQTGQPRTGLAAVVSAGAFVSSFVVGAVAALSPASPFPLEPAPFIRDVFFYLLAASAMFYIYLSAEIFLWQAVGLIAFYVFFVGLVFWMDSSVERREGREEEMIKLPEWESREAVQNVGEEKPVDSLLGVCELLGKITCVCEVPVANFLRLTIPSPSLSEWSRFYSAANIAFCPIILLYYFSSFITMDKRLVFLIPYSNFPLWSIVLFISCFLALLHFFLEKEPPETEQTPTAIASFVMSVVWISTLAGELLNCLSAIGTIMNLPPAILGLTVLAWGNSVGDLVADVALARARQPATAMAGCFAGPMFNMLIGLGSAMVMEAAKVYPLAYKLQFHVSIVVAFVFLLLTLMGSLLVVTWFRFRMPRFWGFCLMGLYVSFTAVSLVMAMISR
ncbi:Cation/calcium exchanger 5 [Apostasia shenzhenica]|uniref:Cation/calcium exchanger 5 n=1 Tax=Apostasia shenzhenica TaxID=1088818 RepID=A0A2I0AUT4_9ASPA|nr:Cation/calcium exchanger 5 [Apostasia shenzhenica]